jgi:DNA-binding NtrC family response regulator
MDHHETTIDSKILVLTHPERRNLPLEHLVRQGLRFLFTGRCNEARKILDARPSEHWVVLTDTRLPDGTWRDVLRHVLEAGVRAEVVVCADRYNRELWLEALALGAFDLLAPPYPEETTRRIVEAAAASCDDYPYSI